MLGARWTTAFLLVVGAAVVGCNGMTPGGDGGGNADLNVATSDRAVIADLIATLPIDGPGPVDDLLPSPDLTAVPDLTDTNDYAIAPDLAPPPDLTPPSDLVSPPDFLPLPDLVPPPDFLPLPDLVPPPDMTAPTCSDGIKNGKETDVDCGGGTCPVCADGKACALDSDCAPKSACVNGQCAAVVAAALVLNPARSPLTGTAGGTTITLVSTTGFNARDSVLLHQTQGTNAGAWEEAEVVAVNNGTTITVKKTLLNSYSSSGGNNHAQAVALIAYGALALQSGANVTGPAWDGMTGGILGLKIGGTLTIKTGAILSMDGKGYRGTSHPGIVRNTNGISGESSLGPGAQTTANTLTSPNGAGGCGGYQIQGMNGTGGGGGGSAAAGGNAPKNPYGVPGVNGGQAIGQPALPTMFFGGAGGEGAYDEDGFQAGGGGHGGGILYLRAGGIVMTGGAITTKGLVGGNGTNQCAAGCAGSGMAGGGGGAGGTLYLRTDVAVLSANALLAGGGGAGLGDGGWGNDGGAGSAGRIRVDFNSINGQMVGSAGATTEIGKTTQPAAYPSMPVP